jgi:NADPH:quinone reductase-like Zn-dependent oxidoreductase
MKAAVLTKYGPPEVIQTMDVEKPTPSDDEVLIKVAASSVKYGDILVRDFKHKSLKDFNMPSIMFPLVKLMFGLNKPNVKILGAEFSGVVESVGEKVTSFKAGDEVFGYPGQSFGSQAEYFCMKESATLAHKPQNVSFDEAAVLSYGSLIAYSILESLTINENSNILILGASGAIGAAALQIATNHYKAKVTAVCGANRIEFVKKLGAVKVLDYAKDNITESTGKYDIIIDILGKYSLSQFRKTLKEDGKYVYVSFKMRKVFQMMWTSLFGKQKVLCKMGGDSADVLKKVLPLIESGKLKAEIDKTFTLNQVAEAHSYMESGSHKGYVVITI